MRKLMWLLLLIGLTSNLSASCYAKQTLLVSPPEVKEAYLKAMQAIASSKNGNGRLFVTIYSLDDPQIIAGLMSLARKGHVLYEPDRFRHDVQGDNREKNVMERLQMTALVVKPFPKQDGINQLHEKIFYVDTPAPYALIGTGNFDQESLEKVDYVIPSPARDFVLMIEGEEEKQCLEEIVHIFNENWQGHPYESTHPDLITGPKGQREKLLSFIQSAEKSLHIYQVDITDQEMFAALLEALGRGVRVEIIMMAHPFSKTKDNNVPHQAALVQAGAKLYLLKDLYQHAKMVERDGHELLLSSTNWYKNSIDHTVELSIKSRDQGVLAKFTDQFSKDKANSIPFRAPS